MSAPPLKPDTKYRLKTSRVESNNMNLGISTSENDKNLTSFYFSYSTPIQVGDNLMTNFIFYIKIKELYKELVKYDVTVFTDENNVKIEWKEEVVKGEKTITVMNTLKKKIIPEIVDGNKVWSITTPNLPIPIGDAMITGSLASLSFQVVKNISSSLGILLISFIIALVAIGLAGAIWLGGWLKESKNIESRSPELPNSKLKLISNMVSTITTLQMKNFYQTDLDYINCVVVSKTDYNKPQHQPYPKEFVMASEGVQLPISPPGFYTTYFSFKPDFKTVLKGYGCNRVESKPTLYGQCVAINDTDMDDPTFYNLIGTYACDRFSMSNLLFGSPDVKWLLQRYENEFITKLATSQEFNYYLAPLVDPASPYYNLGKYFKC